MVSKGLAIIAVLMLGVAGFALAPSIEDATDGLIDTRLVITGWPENPVAGHVTWNVNVYYQSTDMSGTECLVGDINAGDMLTWSCDKVGQEGWGGSGSAPLNYYTDHYLIPCWTNDPAGDYILTIDVSLPGYEPQHVEKAFSLGTYAYEGKISIMNFPATVTSTDGWTAWLEFDAYYQSLDMSGSQFVPGSQVMVEKWSGTNSNYAVATFSSGHIRMQLFQSYLVHGTTFTIKLTGGCGWQYELVTETRTVTVL